MYIGIDIGGTNTRIVASKSLETISFTHRSVVPTSQNYEEGISAILGEIQAFEVVPSAIGIGIAGRVEENKFLGSRNLTSWIEKPIVERLEQVFDCPVYMRNDAVTGAFGEAYYGCAIGEDFFYLTWGTGVGCARVKWIEGVALVDRPNDRTPVYALEVMIGGKHLQNRFTKPAQELNDMEWDEVLKDLRSALPQLSEIYDMNLFAMGGGITCKQKSRINSALGEFTKPSIRLTTLDDDAGLFGSLALIRSCN